MFVKYFGAFFVVAGIIASALSVFLMSFDFHSRANKFSLSTAEEVLGGVLLASVIFIPTFLIGRYFWKIGKSREIIEENIIPEKLEENKISKRFVNISVVLFVAGILTFSLAFFVAKKQCTNPEDWLCGFGLLIIAVILASLFAFTAISLLLLNFFRKKVKKSTLIIIGCFLFVLMIASLMVALFWDV